MSSAQVTISLLPVSLSLVHIPRSRLQKLYHPVLRQILHHNPGFLNVTCNEIELSIFAEDNVLLDFEPIAQRDARRRPSKSPPSSSRKPFEPVEISYDKWSVLQIDSHNEQFDNSGARVNELSALLSDAGISILYQSSYMSDFIFVKEYRLQEALTLFRLSGFDIYSQESGHTSSRPISVPISPNDDQLLMSSGDRSSNILAHNLPHSSLTRHGHPEGGQQPRVKQHSPTKGEVLVLGPDLICVGLSDDLGVDHWGLKMVKLVAFPDLIPISTKSHHAPRTTGNSPTSPLSPLLSPVSLSPGLDQFENASDSSSSSSDEDAYFSHSAPNRSTSSFSTSASLPCTDIPASLCPSKHSSKHHISTLTPLSPIDPPSPPQALHIITDTSAYLEPLSKRHRVPFFSFTRTPEGSSLTADVAILAELFPPHERHMVICSGELDAADARKMSSVDLSDSEDPEADITSESGCYKCLQIDLRRFGLDKHGLVNRFSTVLEENNINHMYSSTFKTANLLVDKKHALRAQALLRSC